MTAEILGTSTLVATVVGSGIMADRLTDDNAIALLANTLPTGAILIVLVMILGPISGAHFNPAVTLAFGLRGELGRTEGVAYVGAQVVGGIVAVFLVHAMFELPLMQFSSTTRTGSAQWLAEVVATFGLVLTILLGARFESSSIPWLVGLYITAAYWFTSSTSFANPAVTVARCFTDTFTGIRPIDVPAFAVAEIFGAVIAVGICGWLIPTTKIESSLSS